MADATVAEVLADAAAELGDFTQAVYDSNKLLSFYRSAYNELWDCMVAHGVGKVEREALYTLAANTPILTPATAGITSMGEPIRLWERLSGGTEDYDEIEWVEVLPQVEADARLRWWKWRNDTFEFVAATTARQLKIEYDSSASAPTSGSIGIDNCRAFLAVRTASLIAAAVGMADRKTELAVRALGREMETDGRGGLLYQFILPAVKGKLPVRPGRWRNRRSHC